MAEIVNLRVIRKRRAGEAADKAAAANRARHGRTKAEKMRDAVEAARLAATLDGARREP